MWSIQNEQKVRRVIDYKTLVARDAPQLDSLVRKHLDAGWELYGAPSYSISPSGSYFRHHIQAMVKFLKQPVMQERKEVQ